MNCDHHLQAFVTAFVLAARRERWQLLLSQRRRNTFSSKAKLMEALDKRYCLQVDGAWQLPSTRQGVFYDFHAEPSVMTLAEAEAAGHYHDALFSMEPGKLAIHFSHEGWSWLCRR